MPKRTNDSKSFFLLKEISEPDFGFTTGTCATASSLAATRMLLTQELVSYVILSTPKGIKVCMEISDQKFSGQEASCSVKKFSGSDPDVTYHAGTVWQYSSTSSAWAEYTGYTSAV